jgi:hypothetical protein
MNKKQLNSRSVAKLPMEQAAAMIVSMGITTHSQFKKLSSDGNRPDVIPADLYSFYDNYPGWDAFIAIGVKASKRFKQFTPVSYQELKTILRRKGISTRQAYNKAFKEDAFPPGTPSKPEAYYDEFEGWKEFLAPRSNFISFSAAREFAHTLNLKSSYQWRQYCREGHKPAFIPVLPDRDYPEFTSWADFLGYSE